MRAQKKAGTRKRPQKEKIRAGFACQHRPPRALLRALRSLRGKQVIITFHSLGDTDAVGGALALAEQLGPRSVVAFPDRTNSESRRLFGAEIGLSEPGGQMRGGQFRAEPGGQTMGKRLGPAQVYMPFEAARARYPGAKIILLDANDPSILPQFGSAQISARSSGAIAAPLRPDILIDHHALSSNSVRARIEWVDPQSPAACELIAATIPRPSPEQARELSLGILSDSAHLLRADARTFGTLARLLMRTDEDYEQLLNSLRHPQSAQNRAAVLEGLRQATWKLEGEWLLASAAVSSHESHVADALLGAGADVAFVGTADKKGARISARLRPSLAARLDLPALMAEVGRRLGGMGGGHPAAAGATGPRGDRLNEALELALRRCAEELMG